MGQTNAKEMEKVVKNPVLEQNGFDAIASSLPPRYVRGALFLASLTYADLTEVLCISHHDLELGETALKRTRAALDKVVNKLPCPMQCTEIYKTIQTLEVVEFKRIENGNDSDLLRMIIMTVCIDARKVMFVGFRGTRPAVSEDWDHSVNVAGNSESIGIIGNRHGGYTALASNIDLRYFADLVSERSIQQVVFCGHSMGGGIAKIVSMNYVMKLDPPKRNADNVLCISFGDPSSFDKKFVENANAMIDVTAIFHSFVCFGDIVPIILSCKSQYGLSVAKLILSSKASLASEIAEISIRNILNGLSGDEEITFSTNNWISTAINSIKTSRWPNYCHLGSMCLKRGETFGKT